MLLLLNVSHVPPFAQRATRKRYRLLVKVNVMGVIAKLDHPETKSEVWMSAAR